jgi:hypothetical protein
MAYEYVRPFADRYHSKVDILWQAVVAAAAAVAERPQGDRSGMMEGIPLCILMSRVRQVRRVSDLA